MANVGAANVKLGADVTGLLSGLKSASKAIQQHTYQVNSGLSSAYRAADTQSRIFRNGLNRLGEDLSSIATKMATFVSLPAILAGANAWKDFADLQKLEKGLTRYGETLADVREIAKLPNIGVFDAAKSLISLKAMKMESDLAKRSIKAFANAITDAGGSAIDLEPALVNLRQFKATRHVNQVDVRQLAMRIPQTYDVLQSAFGTQDTEKLNAEMSKIGSEKWIDKFITELEKIPKAGGGASTALEQLKDTFTFFSASIGEALDKSLGISSAFKGIGDVMDNLSSNFRNLEPAVQTSIVALSAMVVVAPLIIGAIGGIIKLLPILAAGFAWVSAPILAVVAVIAIAAAAIITNWDSVKKFLTESTWWNTIVGVAKSILGIVVELFKVVINIIQGDWSNLGKALVNILKNTSNLITETLGAILKGAVGLIATGVLGLFRIFDKNVDNTAFFKGVNSAVGSVDGLVSKLKFDVPDSTSAAQKGLDSVKEALGGVVDPVKKVKDGVSGLNEEFKKMTESEFQIWSIDLSMQAKEGQVALEKKIKSYKDLFGVVSSLDLKLIKLSTRQTEKSLGGLQAPADKLGDFGKSFAPENALTTIKSQIEAFKPDFSYFEGAGTEVIQKYFNAIPRAVGESYQEYARNLGLIVRATEQFQDEMGVSIEAADLQQWFKDWPQRAGEALDEYSKRVAENVNALAGLNDEINASIQQAFVGVGMSVGELIGDALSGAENPLKSFGSRILGVLGDLLTKIGAALITYGSVIEKLKVAIKSMNGWVALAAGVLAVGAGKVLKSYVSKQSSQVKFAKGGFAYGEMQATVGDNPNARFDPEMIAPYSKVDQSIKKSIAESSVGGGGPFEQVEAKVRGEDLYIIMQRTTKRNKAIR